MCLLISRRNSFEFESPVLVITFPSYRLLLLAYFLLLLVSWLWDLLLNFMMALYRLRLRLFWLFFCLLRRCERSLYLSYCSSIILVWELNCRGLLMWLTPKLFVYSLENCRNFDGGRCRRLLFWYNRSILYLYLLLNLLFNHSFLIYFLFFLSL